MILQYDFFGNEVEVKKRKYTKRDYSKDCEYGDYVNYCDKCKWLIQWDEDDPTSTECIKEW